MARVLYVSHDGVMEPLGQSQVLEYLRRLAAQNTIHLLSFEKPQHWDDGPRRAALAAELAGLGIGWHPLPYHKGQTGLDVSIGLARAAYLVARHRLRIVHCRSYVPSLIGLALKRTLGTRFIFDMRGFWPDERVDGGLLRKESRLYRTVKWFERRFLLEADCVVSLTHAGVRELEKLDFVQARRPWFEVIPTCANLDLFTPGPDRPLPPPGAGFLLGYVGSVGSYYLFDDVLRCFDDLCRIRPDTRFRIVNQNAHDYIRARMAATGVDASRVDLRAAAFREVPGQIRDLDAAIFFIMPTYSKQASAPTRLAELLGCGIPCLANAGVGDIEATLEGEGVGVALRELDAESRAKGIRRLLELLATPGIRRRCVDVAERLFSAKGGALAYQRIYDGLA